jgi:hypothetical protein
MKNKKTYTYFAHSKLIYNTEEERKLLTLLRDKESLEGFGIGLGEVICPNNNMGELGSMTPYLKMVQKCDIVVAHEFTGYVGRGVYAEVKHALKFGKKVFAIRDEKLLEVEDLIIYDPNDWKVRYGQLVVKLR